MDGAFQVRYNTDLTVEEYISRKAWRDASAPAYPFHRQGGCQLRPHGSYARKLPEGVRVRRFRCPQSGQTVSLLPDCLAAHLPGTLAEVEQVVRAAGRPGLPRGGWKRLHPSSYLGTAGRRRWVARRVERVGLCLTLLTTLLPESCGRLEPTLPLQRVVQLQRLLQVEQVLLAPVAGQVLRKLELRMKISGGFRSEQWARDFATLRSVLSTARKQGLNRIEVLLQGPAALLAKVESQPSH